MDISQYLDSTYLKTAEQAGVSEAENREVVRDCIREAMHEHFKLVMIRPDMVLMAKEMVAGADSSLAIGTVIDFPGGQSSLEQKLEEAEQAISDGADELDFVANYEAFKSGKTDLVKEEVLQCTELGLSHLKVVKWIIEVAALQPEEIARFSALIKNIVLSNFEKDYNSVFVKSSTGFFKTPDNKPNGATYESIVLMLENAAPLPVKAAGGVKTYGEAVKMINLGVKRIGTSSARAIAGGETGSGGY